MKLQSIWKGSSRICTLMIGRIVQNQSLRNNQICTCTCIFPKAISICSSLNKGQTLELPFEILHEVVTTSSIWMILWSTFLANDQSSVEKVIDFLWIWMFKYDFRIVLNLFASPSCCYLFLMDWPTTMHIIVGRGR